MQKNTMDETKDRRKQANLAKRGETSIRRQVILFLIGFKNHTFTLIGKVIIVSEKLFTKKVHEWLKIGKNETSCDSLCE